MTAQILAAVIFVGMFALIIMDKFERQYVTLGSAALVLSGGALAAVLIYKKKRHEK